MSAVQHGSECYEICVEGHLGDVWSEWFEGLEIRYGMDGESGRPTTILRGLFPDQPALHGALARIRDLNLKLISVREIRQGKGAFHYEGG